MRRLAVLALAVAVPLAVPAAALAHANLIETEPGFRERVERTPSRLILRFSANVKVEGSWVEVLSAQGKRVSRPARSLAKTVVEVPLQRLPRGAYTVRWRALSSGDGHVIAGVYTFGVRQAAPPATEAYGAGGPGTADHVVRWVYFGALALLVGGLGFRLLVLRGPLAPPVEKRFYVVVGIGVAAALEAGILAFLLRANDALQLPFTRFLYGDLSPVAEGTNLGLAFIALTLGFAVVAAVVFVAWLCDRPSLLWPALVLSLALASGLSLSGHQADESWLPRAADWVHLCAATLWLGGIVQLAVVVWPAAPELRRRAFTGFARLAPFLIAALVGAGVYLSVVRLPQLSDLWSEGYGRILLVKLALVALALAWGGFHHKVVRPLLDGPRAEHVSGRVGRSLLGESAVGMAVLLAAAVLVDSKPPEQPAPTPTTARADGR